MSVAQHKGGATMGAKDENAGFSPEANQAVILRQLVGGARIIIRLAIIPAWLLLAFDLGTIMSGSSVDPWDACTIVDAGAGLLPAGHYGDCDPRWIALLGVGGAVWGMVAAGLFTAFAAVTLASPAKAGGGKAAQDAADAGMRSVYLAALVAASLVVPLYAVELVDALDGASGEADFFCRQAYESGASTLFAASPDCALKFGWLPIGVLSWAFLAASFEAVLRIGKWAASAKTR